MKRSRFTEEQIIGILKEQEAGAKTVDVCRKHAISDATFYKYKAKYGAMDVSDARKLVQKVIRPSSCEAFEPISPRLRTHFYRMPEQASRCMDAREIEARQENIDFGG